MADADLPDIDLEALERAEAALARLSDDYLTWAEADAARLCACLAETEGPAIADKDVLHRLFAIAHDMKGQAATFGYPLITTIAHRLCRLIDHRGAETLPRARVAAHVDAVSEVLARRLSGNGGAAGQAILARLDQPGD
ncbi:MAG: Hpt domain-containing protein [Solirubrobacterales bacterium]